MSALARWCFRHRLLVVLVWVAALAGLGVAASSIGSKSSNSFSLPGTESGKAMKLLQQSMPARSGANANVVWKVTGDVRDAAVRTRMTATLDQLATMPYVGAVTSPYGPQGASQISKDGHIAYATFDFTRQVNNLPKPELNTFVKVAESARTAGLQVELGGEPINAVEQSGPSSSELVGVLAAAIVLFLAFGSLFAMLLPIGTAIAGVGTGLMAVTLLSHVVEIGDVGPLLGALIGLGVGIDYALFIVTRHRSNLKTGMDVESSVVNALNTSGRAVLFAGGTVVVALLGLFVLGMSFLNGMAIASATVVVCTVLAAVTLLPALLGLIGRRALSRRERRRPAGAAEPGVWARWAGVVQRRPVILSAVSVALIAVLALPVLSLRLGSSDDGNNPSSTTTRQTYDLLAQGFGPGFNGPLTLVAELPATSDAQALTGLVDTLQHTPGVAAVAELPAQPGAKLGIVQVVPTTSPQSKQTADLITHLRHDVIPSAEHGSTLQVLVGGQTAIFADFADVISGKLPLFLAVIVALGFALLMIAFRSLLVPLTAAIMNVFAAAASFGVLVAFFQWGWGSDRLGLGASGPVEAFLPVIMLSILFGLSMDYQVFLVSRMHEEWVHTHDNRQAISVGQAETGRVITAAATIMIAVFAAFAFGGQRVIAEFGLGLAAAVAIDAFVIRTVLVPAVMQLSGKANWWLPTWLDRRLPRLSVEGPDEPAADRPEPVPVI